MGISKWILKIADFLKPVLVKMISVEQLSRAKRKFLNHNVQQLCKAQIVPCNLGLFPKGINLIGNIKGDSGLGQSCRLLANALVNSDYPVCMVEYSISAKLSRMDTTYDEQLEKENKFGVNIFHINPSEFVSAYLQLGKKMWDGHYNIAYWLWELEDFPDEWVDCINVLDEIWTPAEYISEGIRKKTKKPVVTVPYHVIAPTNKEYNRAYFQLPNDAFLFLVMFDCGSMVERKNPRAVIEAFKEAFESSDANVGLVVKVNGATPEDIKSINQYVAEYKNIHLINGVFSKLEINSLIKNMDVVVSLHRAEGFGLVMAEAMLNHVPCIATNWSANTEFMNNEVACMVDYKMVEISRDIGPYKKGNRWAEPDIGQAAEYMRKLYQTPEYGREIAIRARTHIEEQLGMKRAVSLINERVSKVYEDWEK